MAKISNLKVLDSEIVIEGEWIDLVFYINKQLTVALFYLQRQS